MIVPTNSPCDVSIVVVTHNHRDFVERCLNSLERVRDEVAAEVFVVDNRSTDGSATLVSEEHPWVRLAVRDRRRGFSDNNNFAIRQSTGRYVLVLNPDTEVRPGALSALVRFMDDHADVGIAGAKLLGPDGALQPSCRCFPTLSSVIARRTPLRVFLRHSAANARHLMRDQRLDAPQTVDWLLGACLFVRREAIDDVGLLDEGYFLYVEDIDWCYRMHQKGWGVYWVPDAEIIHHHVAASDRRLFSWHSWVHLRSMARYFRKHMAPSFLRRRADD